MHKRIIDRLDQYIELKGINYNQITVNAGLSNGLINKAKSGKSDLGKKAIEKVLNYYQDLNYTWLLTGEGDMLKNTQYNIPLTPEPNTECVKNEEANQISALSIIDRNSRSIEKMVDISDRNSRSIEKMVDSNLKLIDLLHQNGIAVPSDKLEYQKGSANKNEQGKAKLAHETIIDDSEI